MLPHHRGDVRLHGHDALCAALAERRRPVARGSPILGGIAGRRLNGTDVIVLSLCFSAMEV